MGQAEVGEPKIEGAGAAADRGLGLEDADLQSGARERDRRGEAVRTGADDDGVQGSVRAPHPGGIEKSVRSTMTTPLLAPEALSTRLVMPSLSATAWASASNSAEV